MTKKYFSLILLIAGIIVIHSLITNCTNPESQNKEPHNEISKIDSKFLTQYSGGYMIKVKNQKQGNDTEMYVLHKNGVAQWMWIEVISGKTNILSKKEGSWKATSESISIDIKGNTGSISEKYSLIDGQFTYGSRYLMKTN